MSLKLFALVLALQLTCSAAGFCQADEKITLVRAIETAEKNYPAIRAAQFKKQASDQIVKSRRAEHLPALIWQNQISYGTANGAVGTFWPNEGYAIPTSGATRPDGVNSSAFSFGSYSTLAVNWPAFNFGKIKARVDEAKARSNEAEAEYQNELFQQKVKVADIYLLLLNQQKIVLAEQQNVRRAELLKQTITAAAKSGLRPGVDSSYINAEYSKAKILLLEAQGLEKSYKVKLAEQIGTSNSRIEADTMNFFTDFPDTTLHELKTENNPALKVYDLRIKSSIARANANQKSYFPSVRLLAAGIARGSGISNTDPNVASPLFSQGVPYKVYNALFGVYFLWNVLDYPRIRREYKAQVFESQEAKTAYEEEKLKIDGQVENARIQFRIAQNQTLEAPVQLNSAVDAYNQSDARYQSGLATIVELTQSSYILVRAQSDYAIARTNLWRAQLLKAAATGNFDLFIQNVK
jgi:outer membrane protein TolC